MAEPIQLTFDIDDGIPRGEGDRVLCVGRYSHFRGRRGKVTGIWERNVYVRFDNISGEIRMWKFQLQRLTQTGGAS